MMIRVPRLWCLCLKIWQVRRLCKITLCITHRKQFAKLFYNRITRNSDKGEEVFELIKVITS